MSGGTSGEQIPNPHNNNQSVDENSQTGNGVGETEGCPMAHQLNQSKIMMITSVDKWQKKEIIVVLKKSRIL